ncbi:hypothetical protein K3495_g13533 [Podosphaera aphanis]|nr:hypothetical protein K3495_g13533 [Podosphaera aphanis]
MKLARESEFDEKIVVDGICQAVVDLDWNQSSIWGYVIEGLAHDLILGEPWMRFNDVVYRARTRELYMEKIRYQIRTYSSIISSSDISMIRHTKFASYLKKSFNPKNEPGNENSISVFAASIHNINKMLAPKQRLTQEEIKSRLPHQVQHHFHLFEADNNDSTNLPPHRPGVDMAIEIEKDEQGCTKEIPKGPLYGMSRDELLCLRKEIMELLDRNWIRASSSPGGAPVLFVKKPGEGFFFFFFLNHFVFSLLAMTIDLKV